MRSTKYLFSILKTYKKNDTINEIMIKSGLIRQLCSGLFIWLPTGKKIINNINNFLIKEMEKMYALEISMPILQPKSLWNKSNRSNFFDSEIMYVINKNKNKFILSPTNEEVISSLFKNEITSYKQLPIIFFQIQNKFRDEIRPKTIIRTKEFLMKDAYSFHISKKSLKNTYKLFKYKYKKILKKLNLKFFTVKANSGSMGGHISHEFHVVSKFGEDSIIICNKTNKAEIFKNSRYIYIKHRYKPKENIKTVLYKTGSYLEIVNKFVIKDKLIKVYICHANSNIINYNFVALVLKFNHSFSNEKLKKLNQIIFPIKFANKEELSKIIGNSTEFIGIFNLKIPIIIDYNVALMSDFITNDNTEKKFIYGVNWDKNINLQEIADISSYNNINSCLSIKKSIEIGHIFNLGNKYSKNITLLNKKNIREEILMGCYGIGVSRILFSIIENNVNNLGIKWPKILLPFEIAILPINFKSKIVKKESEKLYFNLKKYNFSLLLDDRLDKNFGSMFKDLDILGIPIILIISEKNIELNLIEIKYRNKNNTIKINFNCIIEYLINLKSSNKYNFI